MVGDVGESVGERVIGKAVCSIGAREGAIVTGELVATGASLGAFVTGESVGSTGADVGDMEGSAVLAVS